MNGPVRPVRVPDNRIANGLRARQFPRSHGLQRIMNDAVARSRRFQLKTTFRYGQGVHRDLSHVAVDLDLEPIFQEAREASGLALSWIPGVFSRLAEPFAIGLSVTASMEYGVGMCPRRAARDLPGIG